MNKENVLNDIKEVKEKMLALLESVNKLKKSLPEIDLEKMLGSVSVTESISREFSTNLEGVQKNTESKLSLEDFSRKVSFELPIKVESSNKFQWSHWRKYANHKNKWFVLIKNIMGENNKEPYKNFKIEAHRKRKIDDDANFRSGCKPIPDGLKKFGWIKDDNDKEVKIFYEQVKDKNEKTIITLW